jgi:PIN domain nuclease of toxin-antitoxin system
MKLLLDTHVLLWWLKDPALLSDGARNAIEDGENLVYVSAAVAWEIGIKRALGKLQAGDLEEALKENQFLALPVTISHALAVEKLPNHHRDPFDRMLVAQAEQEGLTLVSRDADIQRYPVSHLAA